MVLINAGVVDISGVERNARGVGFWAVESQDRKLRNSG